MKIELDVSIPVGYEATGEYRDPKQGDIYFSPVTLGPCLCNIKADGYKIILRKKATATRPMTAQEIAMLPKGTAFVGNDASEMYAPTITAPAEDGSAINIGGYMISEYCGYRLPNETLIRPFTTEVG